MMPGSETTDVNCKKSDLCFITFHVSLIQITLVACLLFSIVGCEESFQPLKENDRYFFSIYGYLDASADTQWVRIAPARDQLDMPPLVPEMQVTLEHLETGNTVTMNDSLFSVGNALNFINFWTTTDILHGASYRLIVERPDGKASQVTVTLPGELPALRLRKENRFFGQGPAYTLFITGVEHLADVQTRWYVRQAGPGAGGKEVYTFSYRNTAETTTLYGGGYSVFIDPEVEMEEISPISSNNDIEVVHRQIFVASGGPDWIDEIDSVDDLIYTLPGGISNVENGLGYVVGIDSKVIPYQSCHNEENLLVQCPEEDPFW